MVLGESKTLAWEFAMAPHRLRALVNINFINVLSYYCCIHYLVFPALFPSISMVFIDYTCFSSVTEYSRSIKQLLK